jgi:peptide methionine sulfoxide reductase MsrA
MKLYNEIEEEIKHGTIFGESQIRNPEKWKTKKIHKPTEQYRITLYCATQEQKDKIINTLKNVQNKQAFKKIGDAAEFVADGFLRRGY